MYGDDVTATTDSTATNAKISFSPAQFLWGMTAWTLAKVHVGMRVTLYSAKHNLTLETRITVLDVGQQYIYVADDINASLGSEGGAGNPITIYYGAGATGALLDTGPYLLENERGLTKVDFDVLAGAGWEIGTRASHARGELGSRTDIDFVGATTANRPVGFGLKGRWQRIVLRNRVPEQGRLGFVEGELTDG